MLLLKVLHFSIEIALPKNERLGEMTMRRRVFIAGLAATAASPLAAQAQQGDRVRRISVLVAAVENDDHARRVQASAYGFGLDRRP